MGELRYGVSLLIYQEIKKKTVYQLDLKLLGHDNLVILKLIFCIGIFELLSFNFYSTVKVISAKLQRY